MRVAHDTIGWVYLGAFSSNYMARGGQRVQQSCRGHSFGSERLPFIKDHCRSARFKFATITLVNLIDDASKYF